MGLRTPHEGNKSGECSDGADNDDVMLISFGAMWEGGSQAETGDLQSLYGELLGSGFIAVQVTDSDGDVNDADIRALIAE